ncbi:MAG: NUDIX domain-containing protein [Candidatus Paceibacteria bacterium]
MQTPYFRAGAGCVIYNGDGEILVFKRTGEDIWQFGQGGMDAGETPEQTLWRELEEETALTKNDFIDVKSYPTWTTYEYPDAMQKTVKNPLIIGQAHRWWYLEINPDTVIDLAKAHDKEFEDYKWIPFSEFMTLSTHSFKQGVYEELYEYFKNHIISNLTKQN